MKNVIVRTFLAILPSPNINNKHYSSVPAALCLCIRLLHDLYFNCHFSYVTYFHSGTKLSKEDLDKEHLRAIPLKNTFQTVKMSMLVSKELHNSSHFASLLCKEMWALKNTITILTCQRGSLSSGKIWKYFSASWTGGSVCSRRLVQHCTNFTRDSKVYRPSRSLP